MKKIGLDRAVNYQNVIKDIEGWVDAKMFYPADFDLCYLKIKDKKEKCGWASGFGWDGLNIKENDEVTYWKRKVE